MNPRQRTLDAIQTSLRSAGVRAKAEPATRDTPPGDVALQVLPGGQFLHVAFHAGLTPQRLKQLLPGLRRERRENHYAALCVRRMSWPLLDACKQAGVALFDLEGNAFVRLPGIHIETIRPTRQSRPAPASGTVFTAKASRIVRAFLQRYPQDWVQADLVRETGLSPGYVSRLVARMSERGYVSERLRLLFLEDPDRLLEDWRAHYRFDRHQKLQFAISAGNYEEGIEKLGSQLQTATGQFAWTGWTGGHLRAPFATPATYVAYVSEPPTFARSVFPVEQQGNVVLYIPHDPGVFQFTTATPMGEVVSDAQLYLDLACMPGRAKEQAEALRHHRLNFARTNP